MPREAGCASYALYRTTMKTLARIPGHQGLLCRSVLPLLHSLARLTERSWSRYERRVLSIGRLLVVLRLRYSSTFVGYLSSHCPWRIYESLHLSRPFIRKFP